MSSIVLPGRGYGDAMQEGAGQPDTMVLGPVPEGRWLRRLNVSWQTDSSGDIVFWVGLARSNSVDESAIRAAQTLMDAGPSAVFGRRAWQLEAGASASGRLVMDIGRFVDAGPVWVIGRALGISVGWAMQFSLETLQVVSSEGTESGASE